MAVSLPGEVVELLPPGSRAVPLARGKGVWRLDNAAAQPVVLRRRHVAIRIAPAAFAAHVAWVHDFLTLLRSDRVATPQPVPLLHGSSVAVAADAVWEIVSYVAGQPVGWSRQPAMVTLGAFLGDFHHASTQVAIAGRVGNTVEVAALADASTWIDLDVGGSAGEIIHHAIDDVRAGLDRIDHLAAERSVIHGDFTNHNVLAVGAPAVPTGVIDFSNAYSDATLADVGFALWRSGRPSQRALCFDPRRIAAYVSGYHSVRPLQDEDAETVIVYLQARGLQIAAKQTSRGETVDEPLIARLAWLHDNLDDLTSSVAQRLRRHDSR
ncbi:MAG TPA: phosphotransferase [Acidimicrobiales bacterium]|nr:phosphotransferase [Acidimicrobiales bacterium]